MKWRTKRENQALLRALNLPAGTAELRTTVVECVAAHRDRPIVLVSRRGHSDAPSGSVTPLGHIDCIFYDNTASGYYQDQIIAHELCAPAQRRCRPSTTSAIPMCVIAAFTARNVRHRCVHC